MIRRKAALFRLYPTPGQASHMAQIAGACRFVYNLALEQRRDWYRPGRKFTFVSQCRELTQLRAEVDWLRAAPIHPLQQALRDLERAYRNWWVGCARAPTPRKKGAGDSFRFPDPVSLKVERTGRSSGRIKLPKLGWVRVRERRWRTLPGAICNMTISRRAGQWFAAVQCEQEVADPEPSMLPPVGIDMGVAVFASLSDGSSIASGNYGKNALRALRRAQRSLSRKRRGSSNRRKAIRHVARVQQRVANARKDFLHKHSAAIAKSHGTVVVEALAVRSMAASAAGTAAAPGRNVRQKSGLNRAILDQGWRSFRIMLAYKLAERGGRLIAVPAAYTSQTCAACGVVDASSRLDQARFVCVACGHQDNADTNAAVNILRRGDFRVEACGGTPHQAARRSRNHPKGCLNAELRNLRPSGRRGSQTREPVMRFAAHSLAIAVIAAMYSAPSPAAQSAQPFYVGKQITITVGEPPAGGADAYARLVQRHLARHIPGAPAIVVQNMPGAGSLKAVTWLSTAPADGTGMVIFNSELVAQSLIAPQRVNVDFRQFNWIGNVSEDLRVCYVWAASGIADWQALKSRAKPLFWGATTAGTNGYADLAMLQQLFGVKIKPVQGYAGAADKRLAVERREIDGDCGGWSAIPPDWLRDHKINIVVRFSPTLVRGIDPRIPFAGDLVRNDRERKLYDFIAAPERLGRLFVMSAKVPADRAAALRTAFNAMLADPAFRAEATRLNLLVAPMTGNEVARRIADLYTTPTDVVAQAKKILGQ